MAKKLKLSLIIITIFILCSCNSKNTNQNIEYFYNPYVQKIIEYNSQSHQVSLWNTTLNQFQYSVDNESLYVDGNSVSNEFKLISFKDNIEKEIIKFNKGEGVFPIGLDENKMYFIHSYYKENGKEEYNKRTLAVLDLKTKKIEDFKHTRGLIDYGAVNKNTIYYSTYNDEKDEYSLMKISNKGIEEKPQMVMNSIKNGQLLIHNDELYYAKDDKLVSDKREYNKEAVDFFCNNSLIQFYINSDNKLSVKITNTLDNSVKTEENIIGIRIDNNILNICTINQVVNYEL